MGQFFHPNIVKLYGVVTVGEPVSKLLSYVPHLILQCSYHNDHGNNLTIVDYGVY